MTLSTVFLFICIIVSCSTFSVQNGVEPLQDQEKPETQNAIKRKRDTYEYNYSNITRTESIVNWSVRRTDDRTGQGSISSGPEQVTGACARCICKASSGCQLGMTCSSNVCGPFRMTWGYWSDGGKRTLPGVSKDSPDAYPGCANDIKCAAKSVRAYMRRYGKDCNGDGVVNCYDYMAMHYLGAGGCTGSLPQDYSNAFNQCVA